MEKNLNWAVLGTGVIANEMAQALKAMGKNTLCCGKPHTRKGSYICGKIPGRKGIR